jgi:hypothetical protein
MENNLPPVETKPGTAERGIERQPDFESKRPGFQVEQEPKIESRPEQENTLDLRRRESHERPVAAPQPAIATTPAATLQELEQLKAVETILAERLESAFRSLPPDQQADFKREGEETAKKITTLLGAVKLKVKSITDLIVRWLKRIPGMSRFFIEQEAKIKTDQLLELRRRTHGQSDQ